MIYTRSSGKEWTWTANLPTCFWKTGDLHPEYRATWTREIVALRRSGESFLASGTAGKLNSETLAFEFTPICVIDKQNVTLSRRLLDHTECYRKEIVSQLAEISG